MLKYSKFAALALLSAIMSGTVYAETKAAAVVNGVTIPQARLDMRVKAAMAVSAAWLLVYSLAYPPAQAIHARMVNFQCP